MPSERKSGQGRKRLAGLLLDTLEFGAPANQKAKGISVVAKRVSNSISDLALRILSDPRKPASLHIAEWIRDAKDARTGGSILHNASVIYQSGNRTDYESRVLSLYRALDGPVIVKSNVVTKVGLERVNGGSTRELRPAEYLSLIERARVLLAQVAARDEEMSNKVLTAKHGRYTPYIQDSFTEDLGKSMQRLIRKISRRSAAFMQT